MLNEDLLNYNALSIDDHLETLHNRLLKNFHDSCQIRTKLISPKDKLKPWINNELKVYIKRRDNFFSSKKINLISESFYNYFRNLVTKKIKSAKNK